MGCAAFIQLFSYERVRIENQNSVSNIYDGNSFLLNCLFKRFHRIQINNSFFHLVVLLANIFLRSPSNEHLIAIHSFENVRCSRKMIYARARLVNILIIIIIKKINALHSCVIYLEMSITNNTIRFFIYNLYINNSV